VTDKTKIETSDGCKSPPQRWVPRRTGVALELATGDTAVPAPASALAAGTASVPTWAVSP